ncbi:zinc-binding dehydrogenase [Actinopolymorpha pittospori]|uniref:NADPH2:quinone reductase n=1 Tax=Actinopolymorpha pittospori TaxID=648752 RepID=A0A927MW67_9ACTN|nr:NADPH2:quinone reductase [Actinopolymorpha pittospori]
MRAAVLEELGTPVPGEFRDPEPASGAALVEVVAAGVNHLDLAKATGRFYTGPPPLPSVVGSDGVGRRTDGRLVYFDTTVGPFGSMAERTLVPEDSLIPAPEDVDPVILAGMGNAGLAAHTALHWRAGLQPGETVVVLGATGVVGRFAVQIARLLGAGRVVAVGRDPEQLAHTAELGADATVQLGAVDDLPGALAGANVIVDLLWGEPAVAALTQAAHGARLIQVGQLAAAETAVAAPLLRSRAIDIRGHAVFHAPQDVRAAAYAQLGEACASGDLHVDVEAVPIGEVQHAWSRQAAGTGGVKLVIVP